MHLLPTGQLEQSATVANNRMNRSRNATGINSYEKDISVSPIAFLEELCHRKKTVRWLDICCGEGKALVQTALYLEKKFPEHIIECTGIDLVEMHVQIPETSSSVSIITKSFFDFSSSTCYDLITCVHGLHYLGDKLEAIKKASSLLEPKGLFVANLDVQNIKNSSDHFFYKKIVGWFHSNSIDYSAKKHLLQIKDRRSLSFPFNYVGADDQAGPNYTGQPVVDSYYTS